MRTTTLITLTLAAIAAATPIKRDLATVQTAFANVNSALNALDTSINAITASSDISTTVADLTAKSNAVVSALDTGAASINATSALGLLDALGLLSPSNALISAATTTVNDLIAKHSIIDAAGQSATVVAQLQAQKASTYGFIGAIVSKSPSAVVSVVQSQGQQVIDAINSGIVAYGGTVARLVRKGLSVPLVEGILV